MSDTSVTQNASMTKNIPPPLSDEAVTEIISSRSRRLLGVACFIQRQALDSHLLTRPLLGELLSQAAQVEEILDAYGARGNQRWHPYRHLVATAKAFANAGYKLLHIQHSHVSYHLLPVDGCFAADTENTVIFCSNVIMQLANVLSATANELGLSFPDDTDSDDSYIENLPVGRLPRDRNRRHVESAEETVAHLATAFLNLAAESDVLHTPARLKEDELVNAIPDPVSEEAIRQLEEKFHNLQSMYDTFVLDTDTEDLDENLPTLRGHISIIFHLLETGTVFVHHYERHVMSEVTSGDTALLNRPIVNARDLLHIIMDYILTYCSRYLTNARSLCQAMLKRYARFGRIEVPVPRYRGFHVRPSTLVSKIAHHYGSEVQMQLDGEFYDASAPLDIFRANEAINAKKRRKIADIICRDPFELPPDISKDMISAVRQIITALAAKGLLVIYERPLPLDQLTPEEGEPLTQFAVDEIARLLAMGKIDIESDITVTFIGDQRVLDDIRLLAEHGYGEDNFGNNIPLPRKLRYLRR